MGASCYMAGIKEQASVASLPSTSSLLLRQTQGRNSSMACGISQRIKPRRDPVRERFNPVAITFGRHFHESDVVLRHVYDSEIAPRESSCSSGPSFIASLRGRARLILLPKNEFWYEVWRVRTKVRGWGFRKYFPALEPGNRISTLRMGVRDFLFILASQVNLMMTV